MSNSILVSLQNISSSLKSINDIVKADNFYDTIYCGKYYDRFSVKYGGIASYLYVIKQRNEQMDRFMSAVERVSLYRNSPFAKSYVYREELLCYDGKDAGIYHDIVLVENVGDLSFSKYLLNNNIHSLFNTITVVKSFTSAVLWMIHYGIHIDGFCGKNVVVANSEVKFLISEKICVIDTDKQDKHSKKLLFALIASWLLLLRADKSVKISDVILEYLESYDLAIANHSFDGIIKEVDCALNTDLKIIMSYVLNEGGDLHSSIESMRMLLKIEIDKIEQFYLSLSSPNSYRNNNEYDLLYGTSENREIVRNRKSGKFGYISSYGESVVDCIYDEVTHFSEGIAVVGINKRYFAINNSGDRLFNESYDAIQWYSDINRFIVQSEDKYLLLNRTGEVVSKRDYSWIGEFSFNRSVVESSDDGRKGFIDLDGNEITPAIYDDALSFENGVGKVLFEGHWRSVIYDGDVM